MTHPGREFRLEVAGGTAGEWDARRVRQALLNLVDNAAQHGDPASPITVSVSGEARDGDIAVAVHNLGAPIPPDERQRIFEPFLRASSNEMVGGEGHGSLGLGLFIARRMAEAHGGSLEVESSREGGTTFTMRLPRRPPDRPRVR